MNPPRSNTTNLSILYSSTAYSHLIHHFVNFLRLKIVPELYLYTIISKIKYCILRHLKHFYSAQTSTRR